jgi:pyridoxal phosphate enzyme (YggS family)
MPIDPRENLTEKIRSVQKAMADAAIRCGRNPASVRLVAAGKTMSSETLRAAVCGGVDICGENYIQEAKVKIQALSGLPVSWHFIGHLQSNKAGAAVAFFDLIHTVDCLRIALRLNRQAEKLNKIQKILIQVNIARESAKSGILLENTAALLEEIRHLGNLSVRGLMTMPPQAKDPEMSRPVFKTLYTLSRSIEEAAIPGISMEELSMGMSGDFAVAIEEGATLVRIGTAIFGKRQ